MTGWYQWFAVADATFWVAFGLAVACVVLVIVAAIVNNGGGNRG